MKRLAYRDALKRGQVRYAWLARTRGLRELGGYIAARADDIVQHAVDGRTDYAKKELEALEKLLAKKD